MRTLHESNQTKEEAISPPEFPLYPRTRSLYLVTSESTRNVSVLRERLPSLEVRDVDPEAVVLLGGQSVQHLVPDPELSVRIPETIFVLVPFHGRSSRSRRSGAGPPSNRTRWPSRSRRSPAAGHRPVGSGTPRSPGDRWRTRRCNLYTKMYIVNCTLVNWTLVIGPRSIALLWILLWWIEPSLVSCTLINCIAPWWIASLVNYNLVNCTLVNCILVNYTLLIAPLLTAPWWIALWWIEFWWIAPWWITP